MYLIGKYITALGCAFIVAFSAMANDIPSSASPGQSGDSAASPGALDASAVNRGNNISAAKSKKSKKTISFRIAPAPASTPANIAGESGSQDKTAKAKDAKAGDGGPENGLAKRAEKTIEAGAARASGKTHSPASAQTDAPAKQEASKDDGKAAPVAKSASPGKTQGSAAAGDNANRQGPQTQGPQTKEKQQEAKEKSAGENGKSAARIKAEKLLASKKRRKYKRSGICRDLDRLARKYKLPPLFFARLIWQESGFNPYALSPAGAQGIAQFMPDTAAIWGLDDPYEPGQALIKSAQYLAWLRRKLGNLGLAAAGYNAGSERVRNWLAGSGYMPLETRNYVYSITGYTIEEWAEGKVRFKGLRARGKMPASACRQLAIALRRGKSKKAAIRPVALKYNRENMLIARKKGHTRAAWRRGGGRSLRLRRRLPPMPWGVQLAGSFSRAVAMKQFHMVKKKYGRIIGRQRVMIRSKRMASRGRRIFHNVRVGAKTRQAASALCSKLRAAGGNCVVMKN
jgi:soluble lytic murein transglycosylase-like protein